MAEKDSQTKNMGQKKARKREKHPGSTRLLWMQIFGILNQYSSKEHPMHQMKIIERMEDTYGFKCMRSTLSGYLHDFESDDFYDALGCRVKCDKRGDGWYLEWDIEDSELKFLLDLLVAQRSLSEKAAKELIEKIIHRRSQHFQQKIKGCTLTDLHGLPHALNDTALANVRLLNEAIIKSRQVSFIYNEYQLDSRYKVHLQPRRKERYVVNPYRIAIYNGRLYLLCNTDHHQDITTYRVDKMTKLRQEDTPRKEWLELDKSCTPPQTLVEGLHMYTNDPAEIHFLIDDYCLRDLVDWFGIGNFEVYGRKDDRLHICLRCSRTAMKFWALSYGDQVEILKPQDLREEMLETARKICNKYQ